jgi:hypothetical protein
VEEQPILQNEPAKQNEGIERGKKEKKEKRRKYRR